MLFEGNLAAKALSLNRPRPWPQGPLALLLTFAFESGTLLPKPRHPPNGQNMVS